MTKTPAQLRSEIDDALDSDADAALSRMRRRQTRAAILVHAGGVLKMPAGTVEQRLGGLGYELIGHTAYGGKLRDELQGAPKFRGLAGPMWGGDATPLRYETAAVLREISR